MKGRETWGLLCWPISAVVAFFLAPEIARQIGWPVWLMGIVVFFDLVLVLYSPFNFQKAYYSLKLQRMGWGKFSVSPVRILAMVLTFGIFPIVLFIWLITKL